MITKLANKKKKRPQKVGGARQQAKANLGRAHYTYRAG